MQACSMASRARLIQRTMQPEAMLEQAKRWLQRGVRLTLRVSATKYDVLLESQRNKLLYGTFDTLAEATAARDHARMKILEDVQRRGGEGDTKRESDKQVTTWRWGRNSIYMGNARAA